MCKSTNSIIPYLAPKCLIWLFCLVNVKIWEAEIWLLNFVTSERKLNKFHSLSPPLSLPLLTISGFSTSLLRPEEYYHFRHFYCNFINKKNFPFTLTFAISSRRIVYFGFLIGGNEIVSTCSASWSICKYSLAIIIFITRCVKWKLRQSR